MISLCPAIGSSVVEQYLDHELFDMLMTDSYAGFERLKTAVKLLEEVEGIALQLPPLNMADSLPEFERRKIASSLARFEPLKIVMEVLDESRGVAPQDRILPADGASEVYPVKLKRDGTPDGRTLVKERPRKHDVKREALSVTRPVIKSHRVGAVGQYKILLSCDHVVKRAATNGLTPPEPGKMYVCPQCSQGR